MRSPRAPPLAESYWVLPGRLLAGDYPGSLDEGASRERVGRLLAAGVDFFVDLTGERELPPYTDLLPRGVEYHRHPIRDHSVPSEPAEMRGILERIESSLGEGRCVYVHCHAGIGRTGTVIGCLLVERGLSGAEALAALNRAWQQSARARTWPSVPETAAQSEYVRNWVPRAALAPAVRDSCGPAAAGVAKARFLGALVGLAAGDALAAGTQGRLPGSFAPVTEPAGSLALALPPGAWTDDTAMALCLAESLIACGGFDARDQLERYVRWSEEGHLSATGAAAGITANVARALAAGRWRRQRFPGSHEPTQLDPEPLSRVAPAVLFAFGDAAEAARLAGDAARLTCQAPVVVESCRVFAAMLHAALSGATKDEVLAPTGAHSGVDVDALRPRVRSLARAGYRRKPASRVRAGSTIVEALESALWAFDRTVTFRDGALLVANLGERSDAAAAAYGQLAGAYYAIDAIPSAWRRSLARLELIEGLAAQLHAAAAGRTAAA